MKKNRLNKALLASCLAMALSNSAFSKVVVGVVNIQQILNSIDEGKKINKELKAEVEKKQKEIRSEVQKLQDEQKSLQEKASLMTTKKRQEKARELREKQMELRKKSMQYEQQIAAREQKLKQPILKKLRKIIDDLSEKEKVDITVEMSSTPVLFAKNKKDLSPKVIEAYNKASKK